MPRPAHSPVHFFRHLPLDVFDHPAPGDAWESSALAQSTDRALVAAVAAAITSPKISASSSFILHAPLELLARATLLRHVPAAVKPKARRRLAELAARYAQAGDAVAAPEMTLADKAAAFAALRVALQEGDVDGADSAATSLAALATAHEIRAALIDDIAPMLGAAGHAPILFAQMRDFDGAFNGAIDDLIGLLRAPIRALARAPLARVRWHLAPTRTVARPDAESALFAALAKPVRFASPSTSIAPTVLAAETSGEATRVLGDLIDGISIAAAQRTLLRIAAWSMLQDDRTHAPYGWTHCLTLPQALLQNVDVSHNHRALIAVAATEVLAMRATQSVVDIDITRPVEDDATAVFRDAIEHRDALIESLAVFAATHRDAHVAKYTVACIQAAAADSEAAPLFLAAAASLQAWWRAHDATREG
jgi:hypothetical protein